MATAKAHLESIIHFANRLKDRPELEEEVETTRVQAVIQDLDNNISDLCDMLEEDFGCSQ